MLPAIDCECKEVRKGMSVRNGTASRKASSDEHASSTQLVYCEPQGEQRPVCIATNEYVSSTNDYALSTHDYDYLYIDMKVVYE